jgi:hypothetical protein
MTEVGSNLLHHRTDFDDWRSLTIGIYMVLVGYAVMVGIPVICVVGLLFIFWLPRCPVDKNAIPALGDAS